MKRLSQTDQNNTGVINLDASASSKGILRLAGDLGGTSTSPTVPGLTSRQYKVSLTVGTSNADYITDGVADNVQLQLALDAAYAAGGGIVEMLSDMTLATNLVLYPYVWLRGQGENVTTVSIASSFSAGVAMQRTQAILAHYLRVSDFTLDLSGKSGVGAIHTYQGDYQRFQRLRVTGQGDAVSKWCFHIGFGDLTDVDSYVSHGTVMEDVHIDNCACGTTEQILFINQHDARIIRPRFENNDNNLAYELMLYINNKNVVVDSPHFESPSANSIGIMESDGIMINNITAKHDDNFNVVTFINSRNVTIDGIEAKNTVASPSAAVFGFFDRLLGPDGFTQLVDDTENIHVLNANIDGWKSTVTAQTVGLSLGTDYTMNQNNVTFENIDIWNQTVPFNAGADHSLNFLRDWEFRNVNVLSWAGSTTGAFQLRGYASAVGQMSGFRFRNCKVVPSTGGGSFAAIRNIAMTVQLIDDCDFSGTFTGYGTLSSVSGGVFQTIRNYKLTTTAPGVGDDLADGFGVGSRWYDTTADKEYVCLDGTVGAAVWRDTTATSGGGATNLTTTATPSTVTINSDTGTDAVVAAADGTNAGVFLPAEKTKLTGIATGATANSSDATLLARANHTGTQSADTLTDGTTNKAFLATEQSKLAAIEASADVTDAANVAAAGALMVSQLFDTMRKRPVLFSDFLAVNGSSLDPFFGVAPGSGTIAAPNFVSAHHPGIIRGRSSTTTNSGYFIGSNTAELLLGGDETFEAVLYLSTITNSTFRMGFHNTTTSADAVSGAYIEIDSSGVATGKTANASTRSSTGTTLTLSASTWYRARVSVNSTATLITFSIYSESGTLLWSDTLSTNIPTSNSTGVGFIGTNTGTTAIDLYHLDYMALAWGSDRTR